MTLNRIIYRRKPRVTKRKHPLRVYYPSLTRRTKKIYNKNKILYCPVLRTDVHFNAEGFVHLLYEDYDHPRSPSEQFLKLKCFPFVPKVVSECQIKASIRNIEVKVKNIWKKGQDFELIHEVVKGASVRVIIRKIGDGNFNYHGVMPHDRRSKKVLYKQKSTP